MNKHDTDVISLAFGWIFLAVTGWWLLVQSVHIDLPSAGWFLAGALIVAGLLGLVTAMRPDRPRSTVDHT